MADPDGSAAVAVAEDTPLWADTRRGGSRRWLVAVTVFAILAAMAGAMVTAAVQQTPTIDEPVYAGAAAVYWQQHDLQVNPEHPPLGKLIIGAGLALAHPHLEPAAGSQDLIGQRLLYESGNDAGNLMLWARLPVIGLTLLFGLVVFAFARDLVGTVGGLVGLTLYAFSPDVIAHGSLATLDVPAAGFLLTSVWLAWRTWLRPGRYGALAALALGAAVATRMSALPAVPVVLLLLGLSVGLHDRGGAFKPWARVVRGLFAVAGAAVIVVAVVWASYLAVDPQLRWETPDIVPVVDGLRGFVIDHLPFPDPYLDGMRIQFRFEDATFSGFLFGQAYLGSLWYYLPAALLVKTPLGLLALWLAGVITLLAVRRLRPAAPYLLLPTAVLFASVLTESRNFGVRYVIVVPMFLAVAAATVVALRWRWAHVLTGALVLFVVVSSVRAFPYYLPYSNEAFGGPAHTHENLHDSNVDWGQDLGRLADRLRERYPGERIWLVYKGSGVPSYYGIVASDPLTVPPSAVRGLLVVSDSRAAKAEPRLAELIATSTPIDQVGYSITIYRRVPPP